MFGQLTDRLQRISKTLTGRGRITEDNVKETLHDIQLALLEADVAKPVIDQLSKDILEKAIGQEVLGSLTPGQAFIKVIHENIMHIMGDSAAELNLKAEPPVVILMAGLQGSGKTTSSVKLAQWIQAREKKSVMLVSTDVYRPAAMDQLATLAQQMNIDCYPAQPHQQPVHIAQEAIKYARQKQHDVIIVDTAGRMHVDQAMMDEIKQLSFTTRPKETLFVIDSMTGQDAANTAQAFNDALEITGTILTKTDGDARGGAALSTAFITGKPIKFMGTGEKPDAFEVFHPDRVASRILGMGDILSLIEEAEQKIDQSTAKRAVKKLTKGQAFDLQDFLDQLEQMNKMGGMMGLLSKIPGLPVPKEMIQKHASDDKFKAMKAIIQSMTPKERRFPAVINPSRKKRIASGSGTDIPEINRLLKQFLKMQKMLKKFGKGGMSGMMKQMGSLMGGGGSANTPDQFKNFM